MRILIIGGSVFVGRAVTEEALRRGHEVTTFNRGLSGADLPGVEAVRGDRGVARDLDRLVEGREWDAVVDVIGRVPKMVHESGRRLNGRAGVCTYVSRISAIADFPAKECHESPPRYECAPDA